MANPDPTIPGIGIPRAALDEASDTYVRRWRAHLRRKPEDIGRLLADMSAIAISVTAVVSKDVLEKTTREIGSQRLPSEPAVYTKMVSAQMEFVRASQVLGFAFEESIPKTREEAFERLSSAPT